MKHILLASIASLLCSAAHAGLSASVGYHTDYISRGSTLGDAAAFGSLKYEYSGFYLGTWISQYNLSDTEDDVEYDLYGGYIYEFNESFSLAVLYNQYNYVNEETFQVEYGLDIVLGPVSLTAISGFDDQQSNSEDEYNYYAVGVTHKWFGITLGLTNDENNSDDVRHIDFSASGSVNEIDFSFLIGASKKDSLGEGSDTYAVLTASKTFEF